MTEAFDTDVLISGAGAAGLTLAIDLARRGVSFRLIDKAADAFRGSRGKGIQPRTQEVFEDLGMAEQLFALGGPYPPQRLHHADGTYSDTPSMETAAPTPAEPYRTPLMLPQFLTERIMRERLAELGHAPEFGSELIGFEADDDGVTVRLQGRDRETRLRVRYLVGADGGRSFVRQALGVDFPGQTLGVRGLVADVVLTGLDRDAWHRFGEGDMARQLAFCPLSGTDLFQVQGALPLTGEVDLSAKGLHRLIAERTGRTDIRVQSVSWASAFTMNARLADRYRLGRVFLAGDAAHTHPPTGGQGLNTSVQDSYNLGWKLAAVLAGAPEALLDTYEEERRPIAAAMLGLSTRLLDAHKSGDSRRGREVHQLDLGYRGSSLARTEAERDADLQAGDRAPDAPLTSADGPVRLFQLFSGPHWTLLGYETATEVVRTQAGVQVHRIGGEGDLRDSQGHFRDAYALAPGDWVLIRPDGYVGAIVPAGRAGAVEAYLAAATG